MALRQVRSLKRQKYQRALNKCVHKINKEIQNDWLWNGRFVLRQTYAQFHMFEDHSGALFEFVLELKDTKTGKVEYEQFDNYDYDWRLVWWVNECITNTWNVWSEDPDPNKQARLEGRTPD